LFYSLTLSLGANCLENLVVKPNDKQVSVKYATATNNDISMQEYLAELDKCNQKNPGMKVYVITSTFKKSQLYIRADPVTYSM